MKMEKTKESKLIDYCILHSEVDRLSGYSKDCAGGGAAELNSFKFSI